MLKSTLSRLAEEVFLATRNADFDLLAERTFNKLRALTECLRGSGGLFRSLLDYNSLSPRRLISNSGAPSECGNTIFICSYPSKEGGTPWYCYIGNEVTKH